MFADARETVDSLKVIDFGFSKRYRADGGGGSGGGGGGGGGAAAAAGSGGVARRKAGAPHTTPRNAGQTTLRHWLRSASTRISVRGSSLVIQTLVSGGRPHSTLHTHDTWLDTDRSHTHALSHAHRLS